MRSRLRLIQEPDDGDDSAGLVSPQRGSASYDAFAFGFSSSTVNTGSFTIPKAATALMMEVNFQKFLTTYDRIVIVAHSLGGLVALEALTTNPALSAKVPLLVTFATPSNGAEVATLAREVIQNPALQGMLPDEGNSFLESLSNRWRQSKVNRSLQTTVTWRDLRGCAGA